MRSWLVARALSLTGLCALAVAQVCVDGRSEAQLLRKPYRSHVTGEEREYFLYLPKGYESEQGRLWPVILFLHGGGERGDGKKDLDALLKHGPLKEAWVKRRDLPFIIISPQMPPLSPELKEKLARRPAPQAPGRMPMDRRVTGEPPRWSEEGPPQGWWVYEKDVLGILDGVLGEYRADPDRVYLTGLSYGGFGTWYFAGAHPERWAAVAPICGAANPKLIARIAEARLPIWIFQGGAIRSCSPSGCFRVHGLWKRQVTLRCGLRSTRIWATTYGKECTKAGISTSGSCSTAARRHDDDPA